MAVRRFDSCIPWSVYRLRSAERFDSSTVHMTYEKWMQLFPNGWHFATTGYFYWLLHRCSTQAELDDTLLFAFRTGNDCAAMLGIYSKLRERVE